MFIMFVSLNHNQQRNNTNGVNKMWLNGKLRILNADGTFLNANTGLDSWFTCEQAKALCDYSIGQRIFRHNGMQICEEVFL